MSDASVKCTSGRKGAVPALWLAAFLLGTVYLVGTGGFTHDFHLTFIRPAPFRVVSWQTALNIPPGTIGAAGRFSIGRNGRSVRCVAVSPDSRRCLVGLANPAGVDLTTFPGGKILQRVSFHRPISSVVWNPNGRSIAFCGERGVRFARFIKGRIHVQPGQRIAIGSSVAPIGGGEFFGQHGFLLLSSGRLAWLSNTTSKKAGNKSAETSGYRIGVIRLVGATRVFAADGRGRCITDDQWWGHARVACRLPPTGAIGWRQGFSGELRAAVLSTGGRRAIIVGSAVSLDAESWAFNPIGSALAAAGSGRVWILNGADGRIMRIHLGRSDYCGVAIGAGGRLAAVECRWDGRIGGESVVVMNAVDARRRMVLEIPGNFSMDGPVQFTSDGRFLTVLCRRSRADAAESVIVWWRIKA